MTPWIDRKPRRKSPAGFTLIEILVVVAIIALLVSILLPSLKAAREAARASVCAHHIRTLTIAGRMWMSTSKKERIPAELGWAPEILKNMKMQTEPFRCPSDKEPSPISPVWISQHRTGFKYPTVATDSAYFRRRSDRDPGSGAYMIDFETEADVAGGDKDFDDATVFVLPDADNPNKAMVWAQKRSTGRQLTLHDWQGRVLERNFQNSAQYRQPVLWGSYGMNLSAALPGTKPWHITYLEYEDWSAVTESKLGVRAESGAIRGDGPGRYPWVELRHNRKLNVGFKDGHVERWHPDKLTPPPDESAPSPWHPRRPPGWQPPKLN